MGLIEGLRDDHAFACGQSVGFHNDRGAALAHIVMRRRRIGESAVLGSGNAMARHEGLGEILGGFELGRGPCGSEDLESATAKQIDDAFRQGRFGAHHGKGDRFALGKGRQHFDISDRKILQAALACGATVTRRHEHRLHPTRLGDPPGDRVFASSRTDDQDLHSSITALVKTCCTSSRFSMASSSFCMRAASSPSRTVSFIGFMVISATSAFRPACSSAALTCA